MNANATDSWKVLLTRIQNNITRIESRLAELRAQETAVRTQINQLELPLKK